MPGARGSNRPVERRRELARGRHFLALDAQARGEPDEVDVRVSEMHAGYVAVLSLEGERASAASTLDGMPSIALALKPAAANRPKNRRREIPLPTN